VLIYLENGKQKAWLNTSMAEHFDPHALDTSYVILIHHIQFLR